jgi:hypothetical protein
VTIHIVKMAVGIDDVAHLGAVQKRRRARAPGGAGGRAPGSTVRVRTRNTPRRAAELLDDGSIYWVIKGAIRARQRILSIEKKSDARGRRSCEMGLDAKLVETAARPCRPFQGWRYLESRAAPADRERPSGDLGGMPPGLVEELRSLGLL